MTTDRYGLVDFAANEVGWTQVLDKLRQAIADYRERAAEADPADHLDLRGRKRGMEHALTLIDECRKQLRRA
jgi:hypothetical protein